MEKLICPICKDLEWVYDKTTNTAIPCRCQEQKRMDRRIKFGNLPETLKNATFENFKTEYYTSDTSKQYIAYALKQIKVWVQESERFMEQGVGLYIYSNAKGSGKTRIVASLANCLMLEKNIPVKFMTTLQIIQEIKNSWDEDNGSESRLLDSLATVKVLIVDDLGVEMHSGKKNWVEDKFYHIINERILRKLPTIYTSNIVIDELPYQERIISRIEGSSIKITFPEESVRKAIAMENQKEMFALLKARNQK